MGATAKPEVRELRLPVASDGDIVRARQQGREFASRFGFSATDVTHVVTAISELARNIFQYASEGEIVLASALDGANVGMVVTARDDGPGIADVRQAMQDGYSTSGGLGLGLGGVRRLMDDFELVSQPGGGTNVVAIKWCKAGDR